jgi:hypothetical protein
LCSFYETLSCSLFFSLSLLLKPPQKHKKKAHHNNKQRREAPFFEDHRRERGKGEQKILSFCSEKNSKITQSHTKKCRKKKQRQLLITTFALVFIASPPHSLLHTRDINNNINKNKK